MVGLFAFLVTHFLVVLGAFPGAFVVFCSALEVRLAGGLVASSPGGQASWSLPGPGSQPQLKGSEMVSRPGVPVQVTPTSSLWAQLCFPQDAAEHSDSEASVPTQPTSSSQMGPAPQPKRPAAGSGC